MVDDEVLGADGGEGIAGMVAEALGEARIVGLELEVRPVDADELAELVERQHAVDQEDLVVAHAELAGDEVAQLLRHGGVDLETDDLAEAPALQRGLELAHQVLGLFLDFEVAVADDAETALPLHLVAREQPADEQADHLLQRDEALHAALAVRQADEAVDLRRHADERVHRPPVMDARELQRQREAEIGDEGERVRRVDGERREHGEDVAEEEVVQHRAVGLVDVGAVHQHDAARNQLRAQLAPARLLVLGQLGDGGGDERQLLGGGEPVGAAAAESSRTCSFRPATRTMKNSSRLLAEMERKRSCSSSGCSRLEASSSTRRLNSSQDSSRLMKRSGASISSSSSGFVVTGSCTGGWPSSASATTCVSLSVTIATASFLRLTRFDRREGRRAS